MFRTARTPLSCLLVVVLAGCVFAGCGAPEAEAPAPADPAPAAEPAANPASEAPVGEVVLTLTTLDGEPIVDGRGEAGQQARLSGAVSNDGVTVCVLVRPPVFDEWFVQPPSSIEPTEGDELQWSSIAFLGTRDIGVGDLFEVRAIAEASPERCQPQARVGDDALEGVLASSDTVKILRLANDS